MSELGVLQIHEETTSQGELSPVWLRVDDGQLLIATEAGTLALPDGALDAVMSRFGAPFDTEASVRVVSALELGNGALLRHVRHLAGYDVIARDYLVYDRAGRESLCALSTTVTAALMHLGRAAAR